VGRGSSTAEDIDMGENMVFRIPPFIAWEEFLSVINNHYPSRAQRGSLSTSALLNQSVLNRSE